MIICIGGSGGGWEGGFHSTGLSKYLLCQKLKYMNYTVL